MSRKYTLFLARRARIRAILLLCWLFPVAVSAQQVIVGPDVSEESLSQNGVRAVFFMRMTQWPGNGKPIKVFVLGDRDPLHAQFTKSVINVFPHQLRRSWDRMVFSGTGQAPIEVSSESEMYERVSSTPGAIGYVNGVKEDENVRSLVIE